MFVVSRKGRAEHVVLVVSRKGRAELVVLCSCKQDGKRRARSFSWIQEWKN